MRVAMIGLRGIPALSGGIETAVHNLAPELVKQGAELTVYARSCYSDTRIREFKGVKLVHLPTLNTKHTEAIVHSTLATAHAMMHPFDIVHFHAMANAPFSILPRRCVVTLHGLDWKREKWGKAAQSYLKLCEQLLARWRHTVISVSEPIRDYFKERYGMELTYIPNGVPIGRRRRLSKLRRFGAEHDGYYLYLGRIVPEKGVHLLISAFRKTKTDRKLLIAGDASHCESYLRELQQSASDDRRIIFTGPLYDDEKDEAFSNAHLFILPSTIEGMPIAALEAMSYGTSPLVSDIEENVCATGGHGFRFSSGDEEALSSAIHDLDVKDLSEDGTLCRDYVGRERNWEHAAHETMRVYREAMA